MSGWPSPRLSGAERPVTGKGAGAFNFDGARKPVSGDRAVSLPPLPRTVARSSQASQRLALSRPGRYSRAVHGSMSTWNMRARRPNEWGGAGAAGPTASPRARGLQWDNGRERVLAETLGMTRRLLGTERGACHNTRVSRPWWTPLCRAVAGPARSRPRAGIDAFSMRSCAVHRVPGVMVTVDMRFLVLVESAVEQARGAVAPSRLAHLAVDGCPVTLCVKPVSSLVQADGVGQADDHMTWCWVCKETAST
jgi:hypothetical protein